MLRSKKITFWTPYVNETRFPAQIVNNFSLAKTASTLAIYVPLYTSQMSVSYVKKEEPPKSVGGEDRSLAQVPSKKDLMGKGSDELALHHPIKVTRGSGRELVLNSMSRQETKRSIDRHIEPSIWYLFVHVFFSLLQVSRAELGALKAASPKQPVSNLPVKRRTSTRTASERLPPANKAEPAKKKKRREFFKIRRD